ncbi:hypothetical protein BASA81_011409 [Batrachochytrium salamandrivorans]|nr:hypothetical protein BASA81_011409 [Batrachochytrium salamandrivorans]
METLMVKGCSRMDSSVVISAYDYTATVLPVSASSDVSRSTLSIDDLCDSISYTTDEDVQLAVEALGGLPPLAHCLLYMRLQRTLVVLLSTLPNLLSLVSKNIARPVFDTLEPALTPLGRFACNQLDRLERSVPYILDPIQGVYYMKNKHQEMILITIIVIIHLPIRQWLILLHFRQSQRLHNRAAECQAHAYLPNLLYFQIWPMTQQSFFLLFGGILLGNGVGVAFHVHFTNLSSGHDISRPTVDTLSNIDAESAKGNLPALIDSIKRDVVETVRTAVEMVSRHAAVYLPGDARQSVRAFILDLPSRLASLTRSPSPEAPQALHGETAEAQEAQNVLTLASESSAMLKGIESVFSRTVELSERMLEPVAAPETSSVAMSPSLSNAGSPKYYNLHNGNSTNAMRRCRLRTSSRVSTAADGDAEYDSQMMDMDDPEYLPASIDTSTKMGSRKSMDMEQ